MKIFDIQTTAGWIACNKHIIEHPDAWIFAATPATDGEICSLCSYGDRHRPEDAGHPSCDTPAEWIGHLSQRGSGGPRFAVYPQHLEVLTAE